MKLLVSAVDASEAVEAAKGGADIIDIKNIKEGSLGASFPWVIKEIKKALKKTLKKSRSSRYELSATLGDLEFKPGSASLAAFGLASFEFDYLKIGMKVKKREEVVKLASAVKRASEERTKKAPKIILAAYADFREINSISPLDVLSAAPKAGADGVMIDTYKKNGRSLLELLDRDYLAKFIKKAGEKKLLSCLAGSISLDALLEIKKLKPEVIGIRSAACTGGDRKLGRIERERVKKIKEELSKA